MSSRCEGGLPPEAATGRGPLLGPLPGTGIGGAGSAMLLLSVGEASATAGAGSGAGEAAAGSDIRKERAGYSHLSRESQVVACLLALNQARRLRPSTQASATSAKSVREGSGAPAGICGVVLASTGFKPARSYCCCVSSTTALE